MNHEHGAFPLITAFSIAFIRPRASFNRYIQNVPLNYVHLEQNGIGAIGIGCMTCELPEAIEEAGRLKKAHPGIRTVFGGAHPSDDRE